MVEQIDIKDLWHKLLKKWRKIAIYAAVGAIVGIIIAFSIPREYQASVVLVPEGGRKTNISSMGGLAAVMGVDVSGQAIDGINEKIYPEILASSIFINEFRNIAINYEDKNITFFDYITKEMDKPWWGYIIALPSKSIDLFSSNDKRNGADKYDFSKPTIKDMGFELGLKGRITAEIDKKSGLLSVKVKMQDPQIAATIADSVIANLRIYIQQYKTFKTQADLENSLQMLQKAKKDYYQADSAYAQVYDKNLNIVAQTSRLKLERLKNEKDLAFSVYQQLATQVETTKIKLQEETPVITVLEPARVPVQPFSPNKKLIIIAFAFLGGVIISAKIVLEAILKPDNRLQ